mmetsp:Transcript_18014/g.38447  ORF Transcript_18014/g.38447 Transcript_18014/m.38447 type:complete len:230 (+) Transcript_18014:91-780(+)
MGNGMCCESTPPAVMNVNAYPEVGMNERTAGLYKNGYAVDGQDDDYGPIEPPKGEQVSYPKGGLLDLSQLRGVWIDSFDDKPVGHIDGRMLYWNEKIFVHAPTELAALPKQAMKMMLDGEESTANYDAGPPARLNWNDGAVWVRDELHGYWVNDSDGTPFCHIQNGQITWDRSFNHPPSSLHPYIVLPFGQVVMKMDSASEENVGNFDPGPPALLKWNDGEVWRRSGKP